MPVEVKKVTQAYKFALDPTPRQQGMFSSHVGGARFAYNWGLATTAAALDAYTAEKAAGAEKPTTKIPSHFDLCKLWTAHKDNPEYELGWVGENFVGTYQAALRDAAGAWKNFFSSRSGKRAGRRMGRPKFKSKHRSRRAFQVHGTTLQIPDAHHVKLPKIGRVKTHESTRKILRRLNKGTARIVRGTVAQDSAGRWHISLTVEVDREVRTGPSARQRAGGAVGIDLGVRDIVTLSDGTVFPAPRHLHHALRTLARKNQDLARAQKGSAGWQKAKLALGKAHRRVANLRLDHSQKMTTSIIHAYEKIGVEGWDVQELARRGSADVPRHVRKARNRGLADAAPGAVRWQLQSKAVWYGAHVVVTSKTDPTGRTCSVCAAVRDKPPAPTSEWFSCPACGNRTDRRLNTAKVLAAVAAVHVAPSSEETLNAGGGDVRPAAVRRGGRSPTKPEA